MEVAVGSDARKGGANGARVLAIERCDDIGLSLPRRPGKNLLCFRLHNSRIKFKSTNQAVEELSTSFLINGLEEDIEDRIKPSSPY